MQLNDQGKLIIGLAIALVLSIGSFAAREVIHTQRAEASSTKLVELTRTQAEALDQKRVALVQVTELMRRNDDLLRQLSISENRSHSTYEERRADGSYIKKTDSQVSKRLEETERQVQTLQTMVEKDQQVMTDLSASIEHKDIQLEQLQDQLKTATMDRTKGAKRGLVMLDASALKPLSDVPRLMGDYFLGPIVGGVSVPITDLETQPLRVQLGWVF